MDVSQKLYPEFYKVYKWMGLTKGTPNFTKFEMGGAHKMYPEFEKVLNGWVSKNVSQI